jgi:hypothetical protein
MALMRFRQVESAFEEVEGAMGMIREHLEALSA